MRPTRVVSSIAAAWLLSAVTVGSAAPQRESPATAQRRADVLRRSLVQAMARRDRAAIAGMIRYPATVLAGGLNIPLSDRTTTLNLYNLVFTPELRCLLDQSGGSVRADETGATLAEGRVRAEDVGGVLKISRITVPPAGRESPPPPSKPQRVAFRWGQGQAQYAGRLYGDGIDTYIVSGGRGTLLEARIERFPGRSAAIRVTQAASGRVLDRPRGTPQRGSGEQGASAPRAWTGRLDEAGDYRIDVVRLAPFCQPSFTYLLTVSLR
jgi:hypothetical protein